MTNQFALVTGSSRGIGQATALRLARSGMSVLAAVRRAEDCTLLEKAHPGRIAPIILDLHEDDSIERAAEEVRARVGSSGLHALVNNAAAAGGWRPMQFATRASLEYSFRVTAVGPALLTRALIPLLERAGGRIVNVGAGRLPLPLLGPGFGAKMAMEAMTDILRIELRAIGVYVSIVEPGMTRWESVEEQLAAYAKGLDAALADIPADALPRFESAIEQFKGVNRRMMATAAPADRVAATIERAITARRPRARYYCGWEQKVASLLHRFTTERVRDAIVGRLFGM